MKKLLLTIAAIICIASSSHSQIMNGGFEIWNAGLPDSWYGIVFPGVNILSQSPMAHSGNYAVNLHIDTLSGQAFGTPLTTGNGTVTTHDLTFVPLSVSFWYKLNTSGGDELTVTALVYSGGNGVGVAAFTVPAVANYTHMVQSILYGTVPATADSIALVFIITHPSGTPHLGTDAYIDDVSVSASTGISTVVDDEGFKITPNPANDLFSVQCSFAGKEQQEIFVTDVTGRQVYTSKVAAGEKQITITTTNFKQGIYYCNVKCGDKQKRKPLVIIH